MNSHTNLLVLKILYIHTSLFSQCLYIHILDTYASSSVLKNAYLAKNVINCNAEENILMLTNGGGLYFNDMGEILPFPMIVHINESSMYNILYFAEVDKIAVVHINMDASKEKLINIHIKDGKFIYFKACLGGLF